jgi:hypothetical protein
MWITGELVGDVPKGLAYAREVQPLRKTWLADMLCRIALGFRSDLASFGIIAIGVCAVRLGNRSQIATGSPAAFGSRLATLKPPARLE